MFRRVTTRSSSQPSTIMGLQSILSSKPNSQMLTASLSSSATTTGTHSTPQSSSSIITRSTFLNITDATPNACSFSTSTAAFNALETTDSASTEQLQNTDTPQETVMEEEQEFPQVFAVIEVGSKQYKVAANDVIVTEKIEGDINTTVDLEPVLLVGSPEWTLIGQPIVPGASVQATIEGDINTTVDLEPVLLVGSPEWTLIGQPIVPGASVQATIEEQTKTKKVTVFKKKRRKGYRRTRGHRQQVTIMRINDISVPENRE
eukprot:TRINITY_DN2339_c0_g1_i7.p1 TRINITY_DN2339_c0_g1~~TRINITY_DN2339_c0_g1_i7.p1  ORF type:complete len:261 (-),score=85.75 TRINITY_DN2339_c0_g1_i7:51-833(-)